MRTAEFIQKHPKIAEIIGIDLRTLALFRVLLGIVMAGVLVGLFPDLAALYTDAGAVPRTWAIEDDKWHRWSLYFFNGSLLYAQLLVLIHIGVALMLAFGWHTRFATIAALVLWASLVNRNTPVLIGGDLLMICLLFWASFLPLGARFSVDAALAKNSAPRGNLHVSAASLGLLLQVMSVYFFSAILKSDPQWVPDYTAVYYALQLDRYATPLGQWLLDFPALLKLLTVFVWWLELLGPLLIFSPLLLRPLRFSIMSMLMCMHIGFLFCLEIGHFPFVSLASLSTFLGGWFWDSLKQRHEDKGRHRIHIYYDVDCGFCLKMCRLIQQFLILPSAQIQPAQHHARPAELLEAHYSWVVQDQQGEYHIKWMAFVALLKQSPLFWPIWKLAALMNPLGIRVYDTVAENRGSFAQFTARYLPEREVNWHVSGWWQRVVGLFVLAVLCWNLATIKWLPDRTIDYLSPIFRVLRIDQLWNMFAPSPLRQDGWMVVPGELADGRKIDVIRPEQGEPVFDKPYQYSQTHENIRWHTYRGRLYQDDFADYRRYYAKYLCRSWNADKIFDPERQAERLMSFEIVYMVEETLPDYQKPEVIKHVLWEHRCFPRSEP